MLSLPKMPESKIAASIAAASALVFSTIALFDPLAVSAATIDAPDNVYVPADMTSGVPVPSGPDAGQVDGTNCALLIQMTGTVSSGLGTYEVLDPANSAPTRTYGSADLVQFVVLPGGCANDLVVESNTGDPLDARYAPEPWDSSTGTGGVVFLGGGNLTLNVDIDATGLGYTNSDMANSCNGVDGDPIEIPDGVLYEGGGGGGGLLGGGGGAGGHMGMTDFVIQDPAQNEFTDQTGGGGGTITTAGLGGVNGDLYESYTPADYPNYPDISFQGGQSSDGGDPGCIGMGGQPSEGPVQITPWAGEIRYYDHTGAGGGGGGGYGGGGGACSSSFSSTYASGGGGGGGYAGGGQGGAGGTNIGATSGNSAGDNPDGEAGNIAPATAITDAEHYLNYADPRLMMGGAGGESWNPSTQATPGIQLPGGTGGGVIALFFDDVDGNGNSVFADGADGATPAFTETAAAGTHFGSSGSGGGGGGQIAVLAPTIADLIVTAQGGIGGIGQFDTSAGQHGGSTGASGGGGGIWFGEVGDDGTNTGPNAASNSITSGLTSSGLSDVFWDVSGGQPALSEVAATVTVGATSYSWTDWSTLVDAAGTVSSTTPMPMGEALVQEANGDFTLAELVAAFPAYEQIHNPKNLGAGCTPGLGGIGLVSLSAAQTPSVSVGDYVWIDANADGLQDGTDVPVEGATMTLTGPDGLSVTDIFGDPVSPVTTDATGSYLFENLPVLSAGQGYTVTIDPSTATALDGHGPTTAGAGADDEIDSSTGSQITDADLTTDGAQDLTLDFGFVPSYRVGNLVWDDTNDNGIAEAGEPGIPGVLVQLLDDGGTVVAETVTDADGKYVFEELLAGDYQVQIPADQTPELDPQPTIDATALVGARAGGDTAGFASTDPDDDVDNDNESLSDIGGGVDMVSALITLGGGTDEPDTETLRDDDATDDDPGSQATTTPDLRSNLSVDFGIFRGVRIGNQVFLDEGAGANENNGVFDADEVGLSGVTVELWQDTDSNGTFDPAVDTLLDTVVTDAEGNYVFGGLEPGIDVFVAIEEIPGAITNPVQPSAVVSADPLSTDNDNDGTSVGSYLSVSSVIVVPEPGAATVGESDTIPAADDSEGDANAAVGYYPDGNSELTIDFGFVQVPMYRIGNLVWLDPNMDGIANDGEPGIAGVLVQLLNSSGDVTAETVTDADGKYEFTNLVQGDYQVRIPGDQIATLIPQANVTAGALDNVESSVPEEADADDDADNDDNGIIDGTGWTSGLVTLGDPAGLNLNSEPVDETLRDDDSTDDDLGQDASLEDVRSNYSVDFGFTPLGSVGDYVWFDLDRDGIQDATEAPAEGVVVNLYSASSPTTLLATTTTDANGFYSFTGLTPGVDYEIGFVPPAGSVFTDQDTGDDDADSDADPVTGRASVTLPIGETYTNSATTPDDPTIDAGLVELVSVGDFVWLDADSDGQQDTDEDPVEGVTVNLWLNGVIVDTTTTNADGYYAFNDLYANTDYVVEFVAPADTVFTSQNTGDDATDSDADVNTGEAAFTSPATGDNLLGDGVTTFADDPTIDAGLIEPVVLVSVGDFVWFDTDRDGQQDADEEPAEGVTVELFLDGVLVESTTTNSDGYYAFDDLIADTDYVIVFTPQDDTVFTTQTVGAVGTDSNADVDTGEAAFTSPATGDNLLGDGVTTFADDPSIDAGLVQLVSVGDYVWFDTNQNGQLDPGEEPIAGVVVNLYNPDGSLVATTTTEPDGSYIFVDLFAGTEYEIEFVAPAGTALTLQNTGDDENDSDADPVTGRYTFTSPASGTNSAVLADDPTIHAGFIAVVSVGDYVWFDTDRDGIQDATESGIAGVTLTLTGPDGQPVTDVFGNLVGPTLTDANGRYSFDNLPALLAGESYTVTATTPAGYTPTIGEVDPATGSSTGSATSGDLTTSGARDATLDFGFVAPRVSVGNYVFIDTNGNGIQDTGDRPVAGATLTLTGPDGQPVTDVFGNPVGPTTTRADGSYSFVNLPVLRPGESYTVTIDPTTSPALAGYRPTTANAGTDTRVDSSTGSATSTGLNQDGASDYTLDFGFVPTSGDLARTGNELLDSLRIAGMLIAAGVALLFASRRRSHVRAL